MVTDILTVKNGELVNILLSDVTGVSSEIAPFSSLYPEDINGDGITEVPIPSRSRPGETWVRTPAGGSTGIPIPATAPKRLW